MGNIQSNVQKISFEDMQFVLKNYNAYFIINTLSSLEQDCLILNTISLDLEEKYINEFIKNGKKNKRIIIYGKNSNDGKIFIKYNQLINLGFNNVYIYTGGLFEWLILQDIYGFNEFPTTKQEFDLLKYKPNKILNISFIEN